jgi:hypothetical protein
MSERFRQDVIRFLQFEDGNGCYSDEDTRNEGLPPVTVEQGVAIVTEWAKLDVISHVEEGHVPATVAGFSELHDYVDANGYGGAFDWPDQPTDAEGCVEEAYLDQFHAFWNAVQDNLDAWIKAGGLRGKGPAGWEERVAAMTLEQRRERLAEIKRLAAAGDFSWSYDECVALEQAIPEEKAALERAWERQRAWAAARQSRLR